MQMDADTETRQEARLAEQGGYTASPACKMLASHCIICGRPLVDAESVERGMGPICAPRYLDPVKDADRKAVNGLVYEAALAAQQGKVEAVLDLAVMIAEYGYAELAERIRDRFTAVVTGSPDNVKIKIEQEGDTLIVVTPFRRGAKGEFIDAWRSIPGRRYIRARQANTVPVSQKRALWSLLQRFFHGVYGEGPQGRFRVV